MFNLSEAVAAHYKTRHNLSIEKPKASGGIPLCDYLKFGDPCVVKAHIWLDGLYIADICDIHVHSASHYNYVTFESADPNFFAKLDYHLRDL